MNKLINQIVDNLNSPELKMKLYRSVHTDGKLSQPAYLSIKITISDDTFNRIKSEINPTENYEPVMKRGNNNA